MSLGGFQSLQPQACSLVTLGWQCPAYAQDRGSEGWGWRWGRERERHREMAGLMEEREEARIGEGSVGEGPRGPARQSQDLTVIGTSEWAQVSCLLTSPHPEDILSPPFTRSEGLRLAVSGQERSHSERGRGRVRDQEAGGLSSTEGER